MIPGANLLNIALRVIGSQTVQWYHSTGRSTNSIGMDVTTFASPVNVVGSFQPVPRNQFQNLGLDFNKSYVSYYTSANFQDLARDQSGDQFVYAGDRYEVLSNTEWHNVDGWNTSLAAKLTA